jgi:hypothetical protein
MTKRNVFGSVESISTVKNMMIIDKRKKYSKRRKGNYRAKRMSK